MNGIWGTRKDIRFNRMESGVMNNAMGLTKHRQRDSYAKYLHVPHKRSGCWREQRAQTGKEMLSQIGCHVNLVQQFVDDASDDLLCGR